MVSWLKSIGYLIYLILIAALIGYVAVGYHFFNKPLAVPAGGIIVTVAPGSSIPTIAAQLHSMGLLDRPDLFNLLARLRRASSQIRSGEYALIPGEKPNQLLTQLIQGKVFLHRITFIEGWTFADMQKRIANTPSLAVTLADKNPIAMMQALGVQTNPEGLFYPDTYFFTRGTTDKTILALAYQRMQTILQREWEQRAPNLPYQTPYDALIVASLIEHETALPSERPQIAGVILRRLQKNMPLQIDPTVLYGVDKPYGAVITRDDLQNDNPYNTYRRRGLPPTPIGMPQQASIHAALHPSDGDALYYVAKGGGKGAHYFSSNYQQHQQYVAQYRAWYKDYQARKQASVTPTASLLMPVPSIALSHVIDCLALNLPQPQPASIISFWLLPWSYGLDPQIICSDHQF